jgi:20S proteasome alpha/beta subunit
MMGRFPERPRDDYERRSNRPNDDDPVTILAAFNFDKGVVLCADTQHSASFKIDASKIFTESYSNGAKSAFAFSGNMRYSRMAIESFESALGSLKSEEATLPKMRRNIEAALENIHQEFLYKNPRFKSGDLAVSFLGSFWSPVDTALYTFSTTDTSMMKVLGYDCLGTGSYLGQYLIRPKYKNAPRPISLDTVLLTAVNALTAIKAYDTDCGGYSEFLLLKKDGMMSSVRTLDIASERYSDFFDEATRNLYFICANPETSALDREKQVREFLSNLGSFGSFAQEIQKLKASLESANE